MNLLANVSRRGGRPVSRRGGTAAVPVVPRLQQQEGWPAGHRAGAAGHRNPGIHPPLTARIPSAVAGGAPATARGWPGVRR